MVKNILKYRLVSLLSLASLLLVLGGAIWSWSALAGSGSSPFILHFNDIDGITNVGGLGNLVMMGILAIFIVILNFFVALELEARDKVLGKIVASVTLAMAILLFIGFVAILNVN
jgi:hypothetical protein